MLLFFLRKCFILGLKDDRFLLKRETFSGQKTCRFRQKMKETLKDFVCITSDTRPYHQ